MNSAAIGAWWRRARTSICSVRSRINVLFGSPVSASWVRHERELLLAAAELLIRAPALGLEGLAHPHERHVETTLQHAPGPRSEYLLGEMEFAAISRTTSFTASHQRRQRLVTSFSGAARWAAS